MLKSTSEIRNIFLDFFRNKNHKIIPSSPLFNDKDKSLLFTNSGMNQFKNVFLGKELYIYDCVANSQRCLRVGGKHNDLENVGYTSNHLTFFEMLGNFSFGKYFKEEAICYAWEILTSKEWFNIPKNKLLVTVYKKDVETYNFWNNLSDIDKNRIIYVDDYDSNRPYFSDNFWYMSDTGPCGPCSEIFYDNSSGTNVDNISYEKYIEIWNLVFIQFDRQKNGRLISLNKNYIDTGMGLERIASILQDVNSSYDIEVFRNIISVILNVTKVKNYKKNINSLRIIADHIRACIFLITENIKPSNEGRGYILRKIIRRAICHGNKLGISKYFLNLLVDPILNILIDDFYQVELDENLIKEVFLSEEEKFSSTLKQGLSFLNKQISRLKNDILDGEIVFKLHDTYGFPFDLTKEICKSSKIEIDILKFNNLMRKQKEKSKMNRLL